MALGESLERAGQAGEAARVFADFENEAKLVVHQPLNDNIDLIRHNASRAHRPQEALQIAEEEKTRRGDIDMLETYAEALAAAGKSTDAAIQIQLALKVSANNPRLLFQAGKIAASLHDGKSALEYYNKAASCGQTTEFYEMARAALMQHE